MVRIRCDASGKTLQVQNVAPGQSINCPACGGTHVVPAEPEAGVANPFEAAPAPPPGSNAPPPPPPPPPRRETATRYGIDRGMCIFHPGVNAVGKCMRCRKALCETCSFRAAGSVYCADCASKPDPVKSEAASSRGLWSLICGGGAILLFMMGMIFSAASQGAESAACGAGVVFLIALGASIVGLVLGITSRAGGASRPVTGLIGLILNSIIVGFWVLVVILGIFAAAAMSG